MLLKRILKYASVNVLLLPINILIAWQLTDAGMNYLLATSIGFGIQVTTAFLINRKWTFERKDIAIGSGLIRSAVVEVSALGIVVLTTWIGVAVMSADFMVARVSAVFTAGVWCYLLDSFFTFRTHPFRVT